MEYGSINGYPLNPSTVGDHIKKHRIDKGLLQKDIAALFSVTEETITNWENNHSEPKIMHFPAIISFLGFLPVQMDITNLKGKIQLYRYKKGLSYKKMGKLLGVDGTTIASWENGNKEAKLFDTNFLKL